MSTTGERYRILFLVYCLDRTGGMEQHAVHLARAFARRGNAVTIGYVQSVGDDGWVAGEPFDAVALHACSPRRRYVPFGRMRELAREADIVHCTGWDASAWGRVAAGVARRPVIVTEHRPVSVVGDTGVMRTTEQSLGGIPTRMLVALHNRLLDPLAYATVAVAESQVGPLCREGVANGKVIVIPNGIALDALRAEAHRGVTRSQLGVPEHAKVVLQVGRFFAQKRQEWSYEAVSALREELGDVRLLLAGDGPERESLEGRARTECADWVQFLGHRTDVARLLWLSDLAVLPSSAEALSMAMLEALAVGVPQVATDVGEAGPVLRDSGAGLVVAADDRDGFLQACRTALTDRPRADAMRAAAQPAAEAFSLERMTSAYEELFDGAVAEWYASHPRRRAHPAMSR